MERHHAFIACLATALTTALILVLSGHSEPLLAGQPLDTGYRYCTAAFAVTHPDYGKGNLGSGHCRLMRNAYNGSDDEIGKVRRWRDNDYLDALYVATRVPSPPRLANGVKVTGSATPTLGERVCMYGSVSGWSCGEVLSPDYGYAADPRLIRTNLYKATPGDSGSPLVSAATHKALGVLKGGHPDGYVWFVPVKLIERKFGVRVRG